MSNEDLDFAKRALSWYRQYNKSPQQNLSKEQLAALASLRKNKDIVIQKSGKGNSVVVVDKETYVKRMGNLLSDQRKFERENFDIFSISSQCSGIFYLHISTKVFCKFIVSLWVCVVRHSQSTQNSNFAISFSYLKEHVKDEVYFLAADEHKKFLLQIDTVILGMCGQACPNYPK